MECSSSLQPEEEKSKIKLQMDANNQDFVAIIVDFDGAGGLVVVNGKWLTTGDEDDKTRRRGRHLYYSTSATVLGQEKPDMQFIHKI